MRFFFPFIWGLPRLWPYLAAPPVRVVLVDQHGRMDMAWQKYFKQIYDRLKDMEDRGWGGFHPD